LILRDAAAEGKLCPITLEPIEATEEFKVTPCYHAFNKEALQRWLREHTTCPECNQRVY
jgi:SUMO ligase MMS21 Smc5/6 complex component